MKLNERCVHIHQVFKLEILLLLALVLVSFKKDVSIKKLIDFISSCLAHKHVGKHAHQNTDRHSFFT